MSVSIVGWRAVVISAASSRRCHIARRCASDAAISASRTMPSSIIAARVFSSRALIGKLPSAPGVSIIRAQGAQFDQNVHRLTRGEGLTNIGTSLRQTAHIGFRHVFEGFDHTARGSLQPVQQLDRIGQGPRRQRRGGIGARARHQFHHGGSDHAQRALCPDEQLFQVIARVVLVQLAHQVQHPSIGQHHLDPQTQRPG